MNVALRRLRATPIFTLFSIVTLALGIGATTAIYSIIDATVLKLPDIRVAAVTVDGRRPTVH